jgi:hypothetical protein
MLYQFPEPKIPLAPNQIPLLHSRFQDQDRLAAAATKQEEKHINYNTESEWEKLQKAEKRSIED